MTRQGCRHFSNALPPLAAAWLSLACANGTTADPPAAPAQAIQIQVQPDGSVVAGGLPPELFVTDRATARRLQLAEERIARGDFATAVQLLQGVLDAVEDVSAPTDSGTFRSVKRNALDLLGALPPDGRRVYELKYGVSAKAKLADALRAGDWQAVEEVARRYYHSAAGYEATYRLAVRAQDEGEPLQAALLLDRLASTAAAADRYEPRLSLRAASSWQAAGLIESARASAARALARGNAPILGGEPVAGAGDPATLLLSLARTSGAATKSDGWPMFGGGFDHSTDAARVTLAGGPAWSHDFAAATEWDDPREAGRAERLTEALHSLEAASGQTGELTQPAFHPVTVGNVAIVRTLRNLRAIDLATGRFVWQSERPNDALFANATEDNGLEDYAEGVTLRQEYVSQYAWRNLATGALATDGRYVYGVEGAGLLTHISRAARAGFAFEAGIGSEPYNSLFAYDVAAEGTIAWTEGGPPTVAGTTGRFFLGPPLPLGGRLYCLVEENAEIRLVVLDPDAPRGANRALWSQTLVAADHALEDDPVRRLSGLSPAFGDGVLVCPTGAGAAVGIDLGGRLLLWGYQYPRNVVYPVPQRALGIPEQAVGPDDEHDRWLDAVPRIAEGAVLLTPRDSEELHCLDAASGRLRWKRPRDGMLYVAAVHDGKVAVLGRDRVEAYDLATGQPAWEKPLEIDEPAGRGLHSGDFYHLSLTTGDVLTIRLSTGQALAKSPAGEGPAGERPRLGNLIAADGRLISQSTDSVVAFRRLDEFENELRTALANGNDPAAVALRGEDRLHRGETDAGLADLRVAIAAADLPRARRLLAGALLDGLKSDFAAYRRYSDDLDRLTDDPAQKAAYLRSYGDGLREAGEPRAAFETYLRLLGEDVAGPTGELVEPALFALSDRVLATKVGELYATANPADRAAMDAALRSQAATSDDPERLWRFAMVFRSTPAAAEALRTLARRFDDAREPLRAERTRLLLAELGTGDLTPNAAAPPEPAADMFNGAYRAEYIPEQLNAANLRNAPEIGNAVRVIGDRPKAYQDWTFEIDPLGMLMSGIDPLGRTRWAVPLGTGDDAAGPLRQPQARFSAHLMAVVAAGRLQAIDLLSDPVGPKLLWTRELAERRGAINQTHFDLFGRPNGPAGFAGAELLVYQTGLTVVAVDSISGEPVWTRGGIPGGCEISGDRDFVVLQPTGGADVIVLRSVDGGEVARRKLPTALSRIGWLGTRIVSWRQTPEGRRLECRDAARDVEVWSRDFPATANRAAVGNDEVAIFDPPSGKLNLLHLADGGAVFETDVYPDASIDKFLVLRSFGRYLLFTHRPDQPGRMPRPEADWSRFSIDGLAYAFDPQGRRLWSAAIKRQSLASDQPAGLPLLVLSSRSRLGSDQSDRATLLDLRTGEPFIDRNRELPLQPFRTVADPKNGSIVVTVPEARFVLKRVEGALPPPRSDGPDALADPPGAAAEATIPVQVR